MVRRKLTEAANHFGGVLATARWQGRIKQLEKPSSSLAGDRNDAVTVMVVEEVSEGFLPDQKLRVRSIDLSCCVRKRKRNLS